jgi:hypothetical protein
MVVGATVVVGAAVIVGTIAACNDGKCATARNSGR